MSRTHLSYRSIFTALIVLLVLFTSHLRLELAISLITAAIVIAQSVAKKINAAVFLTWLLLLGVSVSIAVLAPYSNTSILFLTGHLLLVYVLFIGTEGEDIDGGANDRSSFPRGRDISACFSVVSLIIIIFWLVDYAASGFHTDMNIVANGYDKNYVAIILVLLLAFCWYSGFRILSAMCLPLIVLFGSRLCIVLAALFFLIELVQYELRRRKPISAGFKHSKKTTSFLRAHSFPIIFVVIAISNVAMIGLSFYWASNVVGNNDFVLISHFNDSSNAIRTNSTRYFVELISSNPGYAFYGLGDDLFSETGILAGSAEGLSSNQYLTYGGWRVVQPHMAVLNMVVKNGLLYSALYFIIVSYILSKLVNVGNISILACYIIANMVMHSLLANPLLILFVYVLSQRRVVREEL